MIAPQKSQPQRFWKLVKCDAQNLARDPVLLMATVFSITPPPLFVAFRTNIDLLGLQLFQFPNLADLIGPLALLMPAFLIGWVVGFLLLEDRDDHTLLAIETTSMGKTGFITYRLGLACTLGAMLTLAAAVQIYPTMPIALKVFLSFMVALETAIVALLLLALAGNKVEGLALSKILNLGLLFPLLTAIPSAWRLLGGIVPSFWIGELLNRSDFGEISALGAMIVTSVVHVCWLIYLLKVTARRTEML